MRAPGYVMLPLVAGRGPVFGALQVEGATTLHEPDLVFVNAVANQLAVALDRFLANRAVRESEAKLAGILSISADAIVSIDEDQRITVFNEGAEKTFGCQRAEVIGASLEMLIPERLRAVHRELVAKELQQSDSKPGNFPPVCFTAPRSRTQRKKSSRVDVRCCGFDA